MIVVRITGGLGNQFFQYAAAKSLAIKHNVPIGLDTISLNGEEKEGHFRRKFKLNRFDVDFERVSLERVREYVWISGNKFVDDYIIKRFGLFEKNVWRDNGNVKDFNSQSGDVCLIGFFANPDYFKGLRKVFLKEFELKDKRDVEGMLRDIKKCDSVSIHVRRGDLLTLKGAYVLPMGYYKKAIDIVLEGVKNPVFYVFSDDIVWCKKNFGDLNNVVFVEGNDVTEDFELMKNCKNNILANSTLSWWVGYLNSNKNPIVVAPKHFSVFADSISDIQLNDWIVI